MEKFDVHTCLTKVEVCSFNSVCGTIQISFSASQVPVSFKIPFNLSRVSKAPFEFFDEALTIIKSSSPEGSCSWQPALPGNSTVLFFRTTK
jgi:hypothetical protein